MKFSYSSSSHLLLLHILYLASMMKASDISTGSELLNLEISSTQKRLPVSGSRVVNPGISSAQIVQTSQDQSTASLSSVIGASNIGTVDNTSSDYSNSPYSRWSPWSKCSKNCKQTRSRVCQRPNQCEATVVRMERRCRIARCRKTRNNNNNHQSSTNNSNNNNNSQKPQSTTSAPDIQRLYGTTIVQQHRFVTSSSGRNHASGSSRLDRNSANHNKRPSVNQQRRNSTIAISQQQRNPTNSNRFNSTIAPSQIDKSKQQSQPQQQLQQNNRRRKEAKTKVLYHLQDFIYTSWSNWSACSDNCISTRMRTCKMNSLCGTAVEIEKAICYVEGSPCEKYSELTVKRKLNVPGNNNNLMNLFGNDDLSEAPPQDYLEQSNIATSSISQSSNSATQNSNLNSNDDLPFGMNHMLYHDANTNASASGSGSNRIEESQHQKNLTSDLSLFPATATTVETDQDYVEPALMYPIDDFTCGITQTRGMASILRIVGGSESSSGAWPWQVVVLDKNREPICGGTLITAEFVLTAAHCVKDRLFVRAGEHDLDIFDRDREQEVATSKHFIHPNYDPEIVDSDIALLKLETPLKLAQNVRPVCLPGFRDELKPSTMAIILGWGVVNRTSDSDADQASNSFNGGSSQQQQQQQQQQQMQYTTISQNPRLRFTGNENSMPRYLGANILNQARVPVVDFEDCKKVYKNYFISENMICAGGERVDSCAGDSGGPLLVKRYNRWYVYGVTSFGEGCGKQGKYGIYCKTSNFVNWIREKVSEFGVRTPS